jgi:hypothetical protein
VSLRLPDVRISQAAGQLTINLGFVGVFTIVGAISTAVVARSGAPLS